MVSVHMTRKKTKTKTKNYFISLCCYNLNAACLSYCEGEGHGCAPTKLYLQEQAMVAGLSLLTPVLN